jgi:hypothetical protein
MNSSQKFRPLARSDHSSRGGRAPRSTTVASAAACQKRERAVIPGSATDRRARSAAGLVPCPLTTFIMTYAASRGEIPFGLVLSAAFAAGLIVTVAAVPIAAILFRTRLLALIERTGAVRHRHGRAMEDLSAGAIVLLGLVPIAGGGPCEAAVGSRVDGVAGRSSVHPHPRQDARVHPHCVGFCVGTAGLSQLRLMLFNSLDQNCGGGRGIRTLETVSRLHTFQACAFNHSATPPSRLRRLGDRRSGRTIRFGRGGASGSAAAWSSRRPATGQARPPPSVGVRCRRRGARQRAGHGASGRPRQPSHQWPVLGMDAHGSAGAFASPFCRSSTDCRSGERTKAMRPSRGGRLIVTPAACSLAQVS